MKIIEVSSQAEFEAEIVPVSKGDFKIIKKQRKRFPRFDWSGYEDHEVYKLQLKNGIEIEGLMSLKDHVDPLTDIIEIELLEVASENIGSNKKFNHIGGCLIAFACRESFKRGHEGYVFLIPKTELIEHYNNTYGFEHVPIRTKQRPEGIMVLYGNSSKALIEQYLV